MTITATAPILDVLDQQVRVLASRDETNGAYEMFEITGPASSGPPPHAHPWTETFLVLEGDVVVQISGTDLKLSAGDTATVPYMATHTFVLASGSARLLSVTDGIGAGRFFEDLHINAHVGAPTPENLGLVIEVAKRNSLTSPLF
jgi:quercetin dioxygenase-like cupin family protein